MEHLVYQAQSLPQVTITGKVSIEAPNCHFPRSPSEFILYFITKGRMIIKEDQQTYNLTKGDILILDPSHSHSGIPCNSPVEYYYAHFKSQDAFISNEPTDELAKLFLQNKLQTNSFDTIIIPKQMNVKKQMKFMENQFILLNSDFSLKLDFYKTTAATKLIEILTAISSQLAGIASSSRLHNMTVVKLINFIHENSRKNLSSLDIEEYFHANFDYLNRIFKSVTGTTIMNYHNRYRIDESKKLLGTGMYNVKQTAEIMGFSNEFYFSRVYKKFEGTPPSQN